MRFFFALLVTLSLCSCGTTTSYYLGAMVAPDSILPLPTQSVTHQTWQDLYLKLDYALQRQGDQLVIEGRLSFSNYPKINLAALDRLTLTIYLLNDRGLVSKYLDLVEPLGYSLEEDYPFRKEISLTPEMTAMSFGYEGKLINEVGGREYIWKRPKLSL